MEHDELVSESEWGLESSELSEQSPAANRDIGRFLVTVFSAIFSRTL